MQFYSIFASLKITQHLPLKGVVYFGFVSNLQYTSSYTNVNF